MAETGRVFDASEVADRMAIEEVISMHCRGVDRASSEILLSCYWPDAEVDYGSYKGPAHAFCGPLTEAIQRYENTQHIVSNVLIDREKDGNKAKVESYVTAHHYLASDPDTEMTYLGRYFDLMEKRDSVWKIVYRKIVMTWHQNVAGSKDLESNPSLQAITEASRYPDDPWFGFEGKT